MTFANHETVPCPDRDGGTGWSVKGPSDFDGDGTEDVVPQATATKTVMVWLMLQANVGRVRQHTPPGPYELMSVR